MPLNLTMHAQALEREVAQLNEQLRLAQVEAAAVRRAYLHMRSWVRILADCATHHENCKLKDCDHPKVQAQKALHELAKRRRFKR